jgi:SAM-dependent methyltransferase
MSSAPFYDALAPYYHLIFEDWQASIERQGAALDRVIKAFDPDAVSLLDIACGIGTQSLGLAALGYGVTASDIAPDAIARARREAADRNVSINFSVADMRNAYEHHAHTFDVVLCADNALPHLLTDDDITRALRQFFACTKPGGLCVITVRDYGAIERGGIQIKPYGVRVDGDARYILFQLWEWRRELYDVQLYIVRDEGQASCETRVMRSTYYAIGIPELMALMERAGFEKVQRVDSAFFQPVLVGSRPKTMRRSTAKPEAT